MNEQEVWEDVPGFEGLYRVSSHGRVLSCHVGRGRGLRLMASSPGKDGHLKLSLCSPKRRWYCKVHQIVMLAFVGERPVGKTLICHTDGDPANNHLSNLRYGTMADNMADTIRHGRSIRGERHPKARLTEVDVRQIRRDALTGMRSSDQALDYGVNEATIRGVVSRRTWTHVV